MSSKFEQQIRSDFRYFMAALWKEIGFPKPTPMQLWMAEILQHSTEPLLCILGFRGFAKTYITCAFTAWVLYNSPSKQVAIWASNETNAGMSTALILDWFKNIEWLQHLYPTGDMASSELAFDVKGKPVGLRGKSVTAFGITGSITGTRGDFIMVDDPETSSNGETAKLRAKIDRAMAEAVNVKTLSGRIIVLGTVHYEDSLYLRLINQGYKMYLFPICVPSMETQQTCWDYYPPKVKAKLESNPPGTPLDRFPLEEIEHRRAAGLLSFERQNLVNPFRTLLTQKPFNLRKLILWQATPDKLPIKFFPSEDDQLIHEEAMQHSSASMSDKLYKPHRVEDTMAPYDYKVMCIDPAGAGKDETAFAVVGASSGYAVLFSVEGLMGGATDENLGRILEAARRFGVNEIALESNYGQDLWAELLRAKYCRDYGRFGKGPQDVIPITTFRAKTKKEKRIIGALDPVINFGRLIVCPDAIRTDYESSNRHQSDNRIIYRLTYQLSYFSEEGNKLEQDDRIDVLASAMEKLSPFLTEHPDNRAESYDDYLMRKAFEEDEKQFLTPEEQANTEFFLPWKTNTGGGRRGFVKTRGDFIGL